MRVVKFGGSLLSHAREILPVLGEHEVLIVPGGGVFADAVRKVYREHSLSESAAHFMAIAAMNAYGEFLSNVSGIPARQSLDGRLPAVLLPYRLMRERDPLPHSWRVTSDSIACYIAAQLGEKRLVILTDVDGIYVEGTLVDEIKAAQLDKLGETCVDAYLAKLLQRYNIACVVANGRSAEVIKALLRGEAVGTRVVP
ncbi:amino acid kinase family protein [Candidatus Pyrohabitans sp.]